MSDGPQRRKMREKAKVSLRALARAMDISPQHLLDLERGFRRWTPAMMTTHDECLSELEKKNPTLARIQ